MSPHLSGAETDQVSALEAFRDDLIDAVEHGESAVEFTLSRWCIRRPDLADELRREARATLLLWGLREPERLGSYQLLDVLAVGGMGKIYRAKEDVTGRIVVVKTVLAGKLSPAEQIARFDTERRLLSRLHDTHIVPLLATGQEGHLLYLVMPYIQGVTLRSLIAASSGHGAGNGKSPAFEAIFAAARSTESERRATTTFPDDTPVRLVPPVASANGRRRGNSRPHDYVRRFVTMLEHVASAVQHIHDARILHRDLKPSNIMIEPSGHSWLIDIGVGRDLTTRDGDETVADSDPRSPSEEMTRGVGTLLYMAPEQLPDFLAARDATRSTTKQDFRTDVWGLGAVLYEIITLRPPFEGATAAEVARKILSESPTHPRQLQPGIPHELEAVCLKALEKNPADRYPTARGFASDLRCWLEGLPTMAGRANVIKRAGMCARRRPAAAFAAGMTSAFLIVGSLGAMQAFQVKKVQLEEARRRLNVLALRDLRAPIRTVEWSDKYREKVRALRTGDPSDLEYLQTQAAAGLADLDAKRIKRFNHGASVLVFEAESQRLLMLRRDARTGATTTRLCDGVSHETIAERDLGPGALAFQRNGTAVQLSINREDPAVLDLYDVANGKVIRQFQSPRAGRSKCGSIAITSTATPTKNGRVAAVIWPVRDDKIEDQQADDKEQSCTMAIWDAETGKLVRSWNHAGSRELNLALSPDGRVAAAWEPARPVRVWNVDNGQDLGSYRSGRAYISGVALGHDPLWREDSHPNLPPALLAIGDASGLITVWDLRIGAVRSYCRGSDLFISALDFSPDGALLLSSGRNPAKIWEVANGNCDLDIPGRGIVLPATAFSRDGRRIAVATGPEFGGKEAVDVFELEYGRGLRPLYGLADSVVEVLFSADGRRIAALSQNSDVGIFAWPSGRLEHVLPAPIALYADSVGLAFDTKNDRFACAAGHQVRLWDLKTVRLIEEWTVPEGLCNALAFTSDGNRLLLLRLETRGKKLPPTSIADWRKEPRVCRLYDLRVKTPAAPIQEITDFNRHVFEIAVNTDATYFAIDGSTTASGRPERLLRVYEGAPLKLVGPLALDLPNDLGATPAFDPTGRFLVAGLAMSGPRDLISLPDLRSHGKLPAYLYGIGPGGKRWGQLEHASADGIPGSLLIHQRGCDSRPIRIARDGPVGSSNAYVFSPDGRWIVWGHANGGVTVCDLVELGQRLTELGLD